MNNTLILYESRYGTAQKTAQIIARVTGNTKVMAIKEAVCDLEAYNGVVFVFSFSGYDTLKQTKQYLSSVSAQLQGKTVAAVGIGLAEKDFPQYLADFRKALMKKESAAYFIRGELKVHQLTTEDYTLLQGFCEKVHMPFQDTGKWQKCEAAEIGVKLRELFKDDSGQMPREQMKEQIDQFIKSHNMIALTTGMGDKVRCSPVEFIYHQDCFYIITEGGLKFRGIEQNSQVSAGIFDSYKGMQDLGGLQITATVTEIACGSEEYRQIMEIRGIKKPALDKLPIDLYMLKLIPQSFEMLYSPLKKKGYNTKQFYKC